MFQFQSFTVDDDVDIYDWLDFKRENIISINGSQAKLIWYVSLSYLHASVLIF